MVNTLRENALGRPLLCDLICTYGEVAARIALLDSIADDERDDGAAEPLIAQLHANRGVRCYTVLRQPEPYSEQAVGRHELAAWGFVAGEVVLLVLIAPLREPFLLFFEFAFVVDVDL